MRAPAARSRLLKAAVLAGREPAESLDPADRRDVLATFLAAGWGLEEIADHTFTSDYTVSRWLDRYELRRTPMTRGGQAA